MRGAIIAVACLLGACTVSETEEPPLAGPSEFALGIVVRATPDSITQDGVSQSAISIDAAGPDGQPARNVSLRLAIMVNGVAQDFGTLSNKSAITDSNGNARATYTSPPRPLESTGIGTVVTIVVTPVGSDYRGEHDRVVDIRLIPPGVIVPPNAIAPEFTFAPESPTAFTAVTFDASQTASDGVACGTRCIYSWSFGDGGTGAGMIATHEFRSVGTFAVQLRVTNERGQTQSLAKTVAVGGGTSPTASFAFSPAQPLPSQTVFFNASASTAAPGRRIVSYDWDFGSGRFDQGITVSKTFDNAAAYLVTLKVTDDANQVGTTTQTVTVGGGSLTAPTASFVFSPENPAPGQQIFFNASASTPGPGRRIVSYRWDFGDGQTGLGLTVSHTYNTAGRYVVTLIVRDDQDREGTLSQTVAVAASLPTAVLAPPSPNNATAPVEVFFNASGSRPGAGQQIKRYEWNFGDGPAVVPTTAATTSHMYSAAGEYTVTVTVVDTADQVATVSVTVTAQ